MLFADSFNLLYQDTIVSRRVLSSPGCRENRHYGDDEIINHLHLMNTDNIYLRRLS